MPFVGLVDRGGTGEEEETEGAELRDFADLAPAEADSARARAACHGRCAAKEERKLHADAAPRDSSSSAVMTKIPTRRAQKGRAPVGAVEPQGSGGPGESRGGRWVYERDGTESGVREGCFGINEPRC